MILDLTESLVRSIPREVVPAARMIARRVLVADEFKLVNRIGGHPNSLISKSVNVCLVDL